MQNISLVYLAAGISSRFGGKIKQLAKIGPNQETLIELSLAQAIEAGITKIILIIGNKTEDPIKELLGNSFQQIPVEYVSQNYNPSLRDKPWGTTDALCAAKSAIKEPFIICNGDDLYGTKTLQILVNHLKTSNEEATVGYNLLEGIPDKGTVTRGIFQVKDSYVTDIKETFNVNKSDLASTGNTKNDLCNMNLFALHLETLNLLCEISKSFKQDNQGDRKAECLLPVELSNLIKSRKIKMKIYPAKDTWLGLTNPEDEEILRKKLAA